MQDEEQETEEVAMSLAETGEGNLHHEEQRSSASSADSHRRRRALAAHHKEFVGEDPENTDDENCLMAMGRDFPSSSSSQEDAPANDHALEAAEGDGENESGSMGRAGEME